MWVYDFEYNETGYDVNKCRNSFIVVRHYFPIQDM